MNNMDSRSAGLVKAFVELHALHKVMNAGQERLEKAIGVPACIPNCGRCCQENTVMAMAIEAIDMISYLPSISKNGLKSVIDIAEGWLLEPIKGVSTFKGIPRGIITQDLLYEWKLVTKSQCPFLSTSAGSICLIHEARPLTCRTFGIYRDAMPICPRKPGMGETLTQKAIIDSKLLSPLVKEFRNNCETANPGWILSGFAPTMLFRAARPDKLKEHVDNNRIASAKLIGVNFSVDLLWQRQIDDLRGGTTPMEAIKKEMTGEAEFTGSRR